jgi:formate hydrogenlyase transcriptional activator
MASFGDDCVRKGNASGLHLLIDATPVLIDACKPDGHLDFLNQTWLRYVGRSFDDLQGWKWTAYIHPEDVQGMVEHWRTSLASGELFLHEARILRADGEYRWMLHHKIAARDANGQIARWFGSCLDIDDRRRVEGELRETTDELQKSQFCLNEGQRLAHLGSWSFGAAGFDYWSPELFRIHGLDSAGKAPSIQEYLNRLHPEDRDSMENLITRVLAEMAPFDTTKRILRPNGEVRFVRCVGIPSVENPAAHIYVGSALDVTEQELVTLDLRKREAYFAEAQRLSHTGSWGWKPDTGAIVWSDETYRIYEYDRSVNPTRDLVLQRVHPEDREGCRKILDDTSLQTTDFEHTFRLLLPDGRIKHVHAIAHALHDARGSREFVGAVVDISPVKEAEEKITLIISTVPGLLWSAGPDGSVDFLSQRCLDFTGMTLEQSLAWGWEKVIHPEDRDLVISKWREAVAEKKPYELVHRVRRFDGEYRWCLSQANPLFDRTGRVLGWYGNEIDVHERKQAEEKVRHQEAELRQILDLTPQLVAVYGPNRERLYANRVMLDYLGLGLEEWRTRSKFGDALHPDDWERATSYFDDSFSSSTGFQLELRLRNSEGVYRWFLVRCNPVTDEKEQVKRWYLGATDIEEQKVSAEKLQRENVALREEIDKASMFDEIVGTSTPLKAVLSKIAKVGPTESTVLICGETGTGKELIARAVHKRSQRSSGPFISVNCAALPPTLVASELFGHEKGAFTGATQRRIGRFEMAGAGSIFLDEVGELLHDTQAALLRVLQEREFERVGGGQPIHTDVRVIAATNRDLTSAVANGTFREDLFYRLNVFPIEVPPLRERKDDILMLVEYFVHRYANRAGRSIRLIDKKTVQLLQSYDWPGNVRELQNVIERSIILSSSDVFSIDELWLTKIPVPQASRSERSRIVNAEPRTEREVIEATLAETRGRVSGPSGAAAKLRVPPSTLETRIRALKIDKRRFRFA